MKYYAIYINNFFLCRTAENFIYLSNRPKDYMSIKLYLTESAARRNGIRLANERKGRAHTENIGICTIKGEPKIKKVEIVIREIE